MICVVDVNISHVRCWVIFSHFSALKLTKNWWYSIRYRKILPFSWFRESCSRNLNPRRLTWSAYLGYSQVIGRLFSPSQKMNPTIPCFGLDMDIHIHHEKYLEVFMNLLKNLFFIRVPPLNKGNWCKSNEKHVLW